MRTLVLMLFAFFVADLATAQPVLCAKQKQGVPKGTLRIRDGGCKPKEVSIQISLLVANETDARLTSLESDLAAHEESFADVSLAVTEIEENSVLELDGLLRLDPGPEPVVVFQGVNVKVTNGIGATASENGLGNLIVGYNEDEFGEADRTGSHNLVLGEAHTYASYGGIVSGYQNYVDSPHAGAIAAEGSNVHGVRALILGGEGHEASGDGSVVLGGNSGQALATRSVVVGGRSGETHGEEAVAMGGFDADAQAVQSVALGGRFNTAEGSHSTVTGGAFRTALGPDDWVAGALFQDQ